MKAKKIVAVVMGAALAGTLAIGMSACSGGNKKPESLKDGTLNIANYAVKYEDYMEDQGGVFEVKGYTKLESVYSVKASDVVMVGEQPLTIGGSLLVVKDGKKGEDDLYAVVNPYTGKKILSGLASLPVDKTLPVYVGNSNWPSGSIGAIQVDFVNADPAVRDEAEIYTYDGTKILAKATYEEQTVRLTRSRLYVGNDAETSNVYKLEIVKTVNEQEEEVEVYVKETEDEKTYEKTYSVVNKSDLKAYAPDYAVGSDLSGLKHKVYDNEDCPVDGQIKDYEVGVQGKKYIFYKNGAETGSVDLTNGEALAVMGNSFYYSVSTMISADATKGYNYSDYGSKVDYSLYKYDIVENTTTELDYDVIVERMDAVYNYQTKAYDAAVISGYKISDDGVAYYGSNAFSYLINGEFEFCYDLTGLIREGAPEKIIDFGGNTYGINFSGNYGVITNANLELKSIVYGEKIPYANAGLISFTTNSRYGFTDFNGKVVIAPEYTVEGYAPVFYGGVAYLYNVDGEEVLLKKDGSVTKIPDLEEETDTIVKTVDVYEGIYKLTTTTTPADGAPTVTIAYYAFDGTLIKSYDPSKIVMSPLMEVNGGYYITEIVTTGEGNAAVTTQTIYKLA